MRYIKDFQEGESITGYYFCKQKQLMKSRAGKNYMSLRLQDKTGTIDAKVWELNNDIQSFEESDFIKIDAVALIYQSETQLNVRKIRKGREGEYNPADYVPCTDKDINIMYNEIIECIKTINNPYIKKLLEAFFIEDEEIVKSFESHSAAKNLHHSYMGGLLEHTLSVVKLCEFMGNNYGANRDILIATAMLHDIGKIKELSEFPNNDYTDDGQLIGHIVIGTEMITEKINQIENFPKQLSSIIKHSILAHHGEYEYGSPKRPKTVEAFILHCADNTDAKVKIYQEAIEADTTQGSWVGYNKIMGHNIRKTEIL